MACGDAFFQRCHVADGAEFGFNFKNDFGDKMIFSENYV
jgi:hypothetical protein